MDKDEIKLFQKNPDAWFDLKAKEQEKRRRQEDADFEVVSKRLRELAVDEHVFPESMQGIAELTGVPVSRVEAIEDRISEFCRAELSAEYEEFHGDYR